MIFDEPENDGAVNNTMKKIFLICSVRLYDHVLLVLFFRNVLFRHVTPKIWPEPSKQKIKPPKKY